MNDASRPLSIHLVAAEESGDALGAALAGALTAGDEPVQLAGIGGRAMAAAGIIGPFPIDALSIIGVTAIPRRLPTILRRIRESADAIVAARPDALVIIDSPDFTHRVARRVRARAPAIPILDYVSPSVWAWRPGRARAMRDYVDCVLAILPFEPEVHVRLGGPPCVYVGHPLTRASFSTASQCRRSAAPARRPAGRFGFAGQPRWRDPSADRNFWRRGRRKWQLAMGRWTSYYRPSRTLPRMSRAAVASWSIKPRVVIEPTEKWAAFRTARAALAASGTVTLELALAGVPTVAAYRVSLIEELIANSMRMRARLRTIILANLVIGENVVPEFIQRDCTPQNLAAALIPLLSDTPERSRQIHAFARLDGVMAVETAPSAKAAATVIDVVRQHRAATRKS